jgi:hypothetical protein
MRNDRSRPGWIGAAMGSRVVQMQPVGWVQPHSKLRRTFMGAVWGCAREVEVPVANASEEWCVPWKVAPSGLSDRQTS